MAMNQTCTVVISGNTLVTRASVANAVDYVIRCGDIKQALPTTYPAKGPVLSTTMNSTTGAYTDNAGWVDTDYAVTLELTDGTKHEIPMGKVTDHATWVNTAAGQQIAITEILAWITTFSN